MDKFVYVFCAEAKKALLKRGFELVREDEENSIWIFENKDPDKMEFAVSKYPHVLSNTLSFTY